MRRQDVEDILKRVPTNDYPQCVFNLKSGAMITLDVLIRLEPEYIVMRGREGGTTDEGRAFFVPYDDLIYIKLDRVVKVGELKRWYGESSEMDFEERLAAGMEGVGTGAAATAKTAAAAAAKTAAPPPPAPAADPAAIAKQNLLDRIRAARTSAGGATAAPPGTPGSIPQPPPRHPG